MVVVCFTAPLSIIYQRRGVLAGVATSILIFFLILFFGNLFIALGRGDRIPSWWAAWTPNLVFGFVGDRPAAGARAQSRPPAVDPGADVGFPDRLSGKAEGRR